MAKHLRRGHCARCHRPALVEVVFQRQAPDGSVGEAEAGRFCGRHRPSGGDVVTMQVRMLDVNGSATAPAARGVPTAPATPTFRANHARRWRKLFPGNRDPWTPLSLLDGPARSARSAGRTG